MEKVTGLEAALVILVPAVVLQTLFRELLREEGLNFEREKAKSALRFGCNNCLWEDVELPWQLPPG